MSKFTAIASLGRWFELGTSGSGSRSIGARRSHRHDAVRPLCADNCRSRSRWIGRDAGRCVRNPSVLPGRQVSGTGEQGCRRVVDRDRWSEGAPRSSECRRAHDEAAALQHRQRQLVAIAGAVRSRIPLRLHLRRSPAHCGIAAGRPDTLELHACREDARLRPSSVPGRRASPHARRRRRLAHRGARSSASTTLPRASWFRWATCSTSTARHPTADGTIAPGSPVSVPSDERRRFQSHPRRYATVSGGMGEPRSYAAAYQVTDTEQDNGSWCAGPAGEHPGRSLGARERVVVPFLRLRDRIVEAEQHRRGGLCASQR